MSRLLQSSSDLRVEFPSCRQRLCFTRRVLAVGSILHECRSGDVVWGSGVNGKISFGGYDFTGVDFRAVRGPLTRKIVLEHGGNCPPVYGDPGLLVAKIFSELSSVSVSRKDQKITFIPNLNDALVFDQRSVDAMNVNYVSPSSDWKVIVNEIRSSSFVVASSLHGIVLSDAFNIPCRPLMSLFEAPFKFEDYFLSTGRQQVCFARSIRDAIDQGPIPGATIDLDPLLRAFPSDVF